MGFNKTGLMDEIVRVLTLEGRAILDYVTRLTESQDESRSLYHAILLCQQSLEAGGKIIVTGVGKSGKVGQKIAATLSSTGSPAFFLHPTEGVHGDLGLIGSQDVVLALSYTGNTDEILRLLPALRARKIPVIGLGGNAKSKLAESAEIWVDARVEAEACPHNLAPTTSTTLTLALGDAIAISLMKLRNFDAHSFAQNHPGGSLGRKLNLTVGDLMHPEKAVPTVTREQLMDEVVVLSTEKKLGAVLVVDGPLLLGLITDGDIRRSLRYREKFFHMKAEEVMTRDPVCAFAEMRGEAALALMENRESQISVLPVTDPEGRWKGLLRLHDLVKAF